MMKKKQEKRKYEIDFKLDAVNLTLNEGDGVFKAAELLGISARF
jgi:transposase-like protein